MKEIKKVEQKLKEMKVISSLKNPHRGFSQLVTCQMEKYSVSLSLCLSVVQSLNEWISQPVIKSFSRLVACLPVTYPQSPPVSRSVMQLVSRLVAYTVIK